MRPVSRSLSRSNAGWVRLTVLVTSGAMVLAALAGGLGYFGFGIGTGLGLGTGTDEGESAVLTPAARPLTIRLRGSEYFLADTAHSLEQVMSHLTEIPEGMGPAVSLVIEDDALAGPEVELKEALREAGISYHESFAATP